MSRAVQFDEYGGIDVLKVREVPRPVPADGEVLVEVKAVGVNPGEAMIRRGALHDRWPATFPSGQGSDLAGVVVELGSGATGFDVGDEVIELGVPPERVNTIIDFAALEQFGVRGAGNGDASEIAVVAELADLVASGELEVPIAGVFALDDVRAAFTELEQRHTRGKLVLRP